MATATGFWYLPPRTPPPIPEPEGPFLPSPPSGGLQEPVGACLHFKEPKPQRKHHYTFDVNDNGLDINGFILQTDKHKAKR